MHFIHFFIYLSFPTSYNASTPTQAYCTTKDVGGDEAFHTNYLSALERLVYLTLASCSTSALLSQYTLQDAASLLHK